MQPTNPLQLVRVLAAAEASCAFFDVVLAELRRWDMDSDDLRDIVVHELGNAHCFASRPTRAYHPGTMSDYYFIWVEECRQRMFLKLLVADDVLWITSFKKDRRYP